jgi:hypothetical protein
MSLRVWLLFGLLFLALMGAGAVIQPDPVRASNAPDAFDANGAFARIERVLSPEAPHPLDSEAGDRVRERLLTEIRALGLTPEVREHFTCLPHPEAPVSYCARVRNVVFSVGPSDGPAILAATHYDSVPAGPGASDAGMGMAAWLEIARLLAQQDLQRRVIFLISDGEEVALLGAHAFATQDPQMNDVQALVNLEARGTSGPASFFETARPNADSVRAYAAGAQRPMTNSMMAAVYDLLPNSTDVTVLRREGLDIVNIAVSDSWPNYHTPQDNLANMSRASLQHMGDSALGTVRAFALNADAGSADSLVFTDILGRALVSMPEWLGTALLAISAMIAAAYFWSRGREGRWRAFAAPLVAIVIAGLVCFLVGYAFNTLRPGMFWFGHPEATRAWTGLIALAALAIGLWFAGRRASAPLIEASAMLWFTLFGLAGALALPGLSILDALAAAIFAFAAILAWRWPIAARIGALIAALTALIIWAPLFALVEVALGYDMPALNAVLIAIALLPWLGPLARLQDEKTWRLSVAGLAALASVGVGVAAVLPSSTETRPRPFNIVYVQDTLNNDAQIIAGPPRMPLPREIANAAPFTSRMVVPGDRYESWSTSVPNAELPAPRVEIVSDEVIDGARTVRLRYATNGAYRTTIRVPFSAELSRASIHGVDATPLLNSSATVDFSSVICVGRACDGAEAVLVVNADATPTDWLVLGQYLGAPEIAADLVAARPLYTTAAHSGDIALTLGAVQPASTQQ